MYDNGVSVDEDNELRDSLGRVIHWEQLKMFQSKRLKVIGKREYPCGPHYNRKREEIVNRVRFSPHIGTYERVCPSCGREWRIVIDYSAVEDVLRARWLEEGSEELAEVYLESDFSRLGDKQILVELWSDDGDYD